MEKNITPEVDFDISSPIIIQGNIDLKEYEEGDTHIQWRVKGEKDRHNLIEVSRITGKDGEDGQDGNDGYTPVKGRDYNDGQDGIDGFDGDKGNKGDKGDKGPQGPQGKRGYQGDKGKDGKSAYEIFREYHPNTKITEKTFAKGFLSLFGTKFTPAFGGGGGSGSINRGDIAGSITNQTDLVDELALKADKSDTYTQSEIDTKDTTTLNDAKTYADSLITGAIKYRGSYDASVNVFPTTGGTGTSGAIMSGNQWTISVGGALGSDTVEVGDVLTAISDSPGQTATNWSIVQNNLDYVPARASDFTNVDNTSDVDKPVSTAQQTALDGKANLAGGNTFSGTQTFSDDIVVDGQIQTSGGGSASAPAIAIDTAVQGLFDSGVNQLGVALNGQHTHNFTDGGFEVMGPAPTYYFDEDGGTEWRLRVENDQMEFIRSASVLGYLDNGGNLDLDGGATLGGDLTVSTSGSTPMLIESTTTGDCAIELKNAQGSMFFGIDGSENFSVGDGIDLNGTDNLFTVSNDGYIKSKKGIEIIGTSSRQITLGHTTGAHQYIRNYTGDVYWYHNTQSTEPFTRIEDGGLREIPDLRVKSMPTSSVGLSSGHLRNDGGTVKVA